MSKAYNMNLQEKVAAFLEKDKISQAKAANMFGISQTALSQWRRNMYDHGNVEEIESKIEEFFRAYEEKTEAVAKSLPFVPIEGYVPTSISEDVCKLIRYCQLEKGMVIIHGDAGIGKTKGAEKFAKQNPASTIYIEATPSSGTLGNILKLLARALRIPESKNKLDLITDIRAKLQHSNKVIIIDEAQHLKYTALEEIRTLSDPNTITGETGTGIALIGNTEVYTRMVGRQEARFAQQFSRIRMNRFFSTNRIKRADIRSLFPALQDNRDEVEFLYSISHSKWGIRGAVNVYNNAVNNENINIGGLKTVAHELGIGAMTAA